MFERTRNTLLVDCGLQPGMRLVVGISGGPDSLTLLDIFHQLGFSPLVAHVNHQLRPEADAEASKVRESAHGYGLSFAEERVEARQYARVHSLSVEEAARELRYRFLFDQAVRLNAHAVAVAHTADDQVETVLMHLLRGAGLSGLKGMLPKSLPNAWSQSIPLVRPLLDIWRSEVLAYCAERGLNPVFDSSNLDSTYYRNRLRHELIPYLEGYQPQVKETLWRIAKVLQADFQIIEMLVEETWKTCVVAAGPDHIAMLPGELRSAPAGVQRHIFRKAIAKLRPGLRDIRFETIERAVDFLMAATSPAQIDLAAGLRLVLERPQVNVHGDEQEWLWLAEWQAELPDGDWPQLDQEHPIPLAIPGAIQLPAGWALLAEEVKDLPVARRMARTNADPYQTWISLDRVQGSLWVRGRIPGDRFQPLGLSGHSVKLSDFMIDQKIPGRARNKWPLILAGDEIAWVPGFRLGHAFRLTAETQRAGYLALRHSRSDAQFGSEL